MSNLRKQIQALTNSILRVLFFVFIVKPLVLIVLGINIRNRDRLPSKGPAIIAANHNSHLDTLVLMSLLPFSLLPSVRPVAAADYFLKNKFISWFALNIFKIIPIERNAHSAVDDQLHEIITALSKGEVIILFPEGTRGEPEKLARFKSGIAHISERFQQIPVIPVFMHGLGKALPKEDWVIVPFFCDVSIGDKIYWTGDRKSFMTVLDAKMSQLARELTFAPWD